MGTPAALMRRAYPREKKQGKLRWTYHHNAGEPTGLGRALLRLYALRYRVISTQAVASMKAELIDAHPSGWSDLVTFGLRAGEPVLCTWDASCWEHVDGLRAYSLPKAPPLIVPVAYGGDLTRSDPKDKLATTAPDSYFYTYLLDDEGLFIGYEKEIVVVPWNGAGTSMAEVEEIFRRAEKLKGR